MFCLWLHAVNFSKELPAAQCIPIEPPDIEMGDFNEGAFYALLIPLYYFDVTFTRLARQTGYNGGPQEHHAYTGQQMTVSPNFAAVTAVLFDWDFTLAYSLGLDVSHIARTAVLFQTYGVACTEADVAAAQAPLEADAAPGVVAGSLRPHKKPEILPP